MIVGLLIRIAHLEVVGAKMKWSDLKKLIDKTLEEYGVEDAEIWYIDQQAVSGVAEKAEVSLGEFHHPGEIEIYVD